MFDSSLHQQRLETKQQDYVFFALPPPHTCMMISAYILDALQTWGIEKKVFSVTLDNASSNDNMQMILKSQMNIRDDLLLKGEYFHVRCSAHILNLIVQDGLKVVSDSLIKIRESVKYVRASESREKMFNTCVENVGLKLKAGVILDVATRWNSTYKMVDRAISYQLAFDYLKVVDGNYKYKPTVDKWMRLAEICDLLEPFDEITNLISGSNYLTSNMYFMQVWRIRCWLHQNEHSRDEVIKSMMIPMMEKI